MYEQLFSICKLKLSYSQIDILIKCLLWQFIGHLWILWINFVTLFSKFILYVINWKENKIQSWLTLLLLLKLSILHYKLFVCTNVNKNAWNCESFWLHLWNVWKTKHNWLNYDSDFSFSGWFFIEITFHWSMLIFAEILQINGKLKSNRQQNGKRCFLCLFISPYIFQYFIYSSC